MRVLYDFQCSKCETVREKLADSEERTGRCECGGEMVRLISRPRVRLEPFTGAFPSAYDRWERVRAEKMAQERKQDL